MRTSLEERVGIWTVMTDIEQEAEVEVEARGMIGGTIIKLAGAAVVDTKMTGGEIGEEMIAAIGGDSLARMIP